MVNFSALTDDAIAYAAQSVASQFGGAPSEREPLNLAGKLAAIDPTANYARAQDAGLSATPLHVAPSAGVGVSR